MALNGRMREQDLRMIDNGLSQTNEGGSEHSGTCQSTYLLSHWTTEVLYAGHPGRLSTLNPFLVTLAYVLNMQAYIRTKLN